jgi:hypothetical protein
MMQLDLLAAPSGEACGADRGGRKAVYGRVAFLKRPRVRYAHKKARWQAG